MLWLFGAALVILAVAFGVCLRLVVQNRREALRMHNQIQSFLFGEMKALAFSVRDSRFAMFENAVIELESRLLLSEENAREQSMKSRDFVQDVSHQFKTPIAGLKLFCEMDESPHQRQKLLLIERMELLINSLLKLEKLRSGGYTLEFTASDLRDLALEAQEPFAALYPEKRIKVAGGGSVRCDGYWIHEALTNLIKNACEHTPADGFVEITIASSSSEVMVKVEDNGGGVTAEALPRLFERFYHGGRTQQGNGVGLGLAIVRTIVLRHHGSIQAHNAAKGLSIAFYLPVLEAELIDT